MGWALKIWQWLGMHPQVRGALIMLAPPIVAALYNLFAWKGSPEEWRLFQIAHPRRAAFDRFMRAAGPHLRKYFRKYPVAAALLPSDPPPKDEPKS